MQGVTLKGLDSNDQINYRTYIYLYIYLINKEFQWRGCTCMLSMHGVLIITYDNVIISLVENNMLGLYLHSESFLQIIRHPNGMRTI